jgi:hypothetical protein
MAHESKKRLVARGGKYIFRKGGESSDQNMALHLGPYEGMRYRKIKHRRTAGYFQYCNRRQRHRTSFSTERMLKLLVIMSDNV